jgi:hypothetical protein
MSQREVAIMPVYCSPYFAVVIVIMKVYRFSVNFLVCSYVVQCYLAAVWNDTERLCTEQMSFMWSEQITRLNVYSASAKQEGLLSKISKHLSKEVNIIMFVCFVSAKEHH